MTQLVFADHAVKKQYEAIMSSRKDAQLAKSLKRAIDDLKNDPRCGIPPPPEEPDAARIRSKPKP